MKKTPSLKKQLFVVGLPALILLLMGSFMVQVNNTPLQPAAHSSQPAAAIQSAAPLKASSLPERTEALPFKQSENAASAGLSSTLPDFAQKASKNKLTPAAYTYPVIHDHRLGSCRGVLKITGKGISFFSENGKDSFDLKYSECSSALEGDQLTIKAASKTFHFKSATARTREENQSTLSGVLKEISKLHKIS